MSRAFPLWWLRSCLALALAVASLPATNLFGGWLAGALALPAGGSARLAWDLGWLMLSGVVMVALATILASRHQAANAWIAGLLLAAGLGWAVAKLGHEFPAWFLATAILTLPLQAWLGWRLAALRRTTRSTQFPQAVP